MRKTALLAAAAALMAAAPTVAQANGSAGLNYANTEFGPGEIDNFNVDGAYGFGQGSWGGQIDGSFGNIELGGTDTDFVTLGGHLWYNGGGWRLGGVVAYTDVDGADSETAYGVEGSYDVGANAVLLGSITVGEFTGADLTNWDLGGKYYFTPNFRAGASLGWGEIDAIGGLDVSSYGISAEYQPWTTPVSFTLGWSQYEVDQVNVETDTLSLGVRWNFGGGTLRERDNATPFESRTGYLGRLYGIN